MHEQWDAAEGGDLDVAAAASRFASIDLDAPQDWSYRGEGAANIVVGYVGSDPTLKYRVLRLRKRPIAAMSSSDGKVQQPSEPQNVSHTTASQPFSPLRLHSYLAGVMAPLIGRRFVHAGSLVRLHEGFVAALDARIRGERPTKRLKMELDPTCTHGLLVRDVGLPFAHVPLSAGEDSPTICFEIKPKWGFLPSSPFVSRERAHKTTTCRFCMHQQLKMTTTDEWPCVSRYCPMDLYSGDADRTGLALRNMISTPQNNARVFADAHLVYTGDHQQVDIPAHDLRRNLASVLSTAFVDTGSNSDIDYGDDHFVERGPFPHFSRVVARLLLENGVLSDIRATQMMDARDIEGCISLFRTLEDNGAATEGSLAWLWHGEYERPEWAQIVRDELAHRTASSHSAVEVDVSKHMPADQLSFNQMANILARFIVSVTAKDCSVMVTLRHLPDTAGVHKDASVPVFTDPESGRRYLYSVTVVDLDPKAFRKVPSYAKDDARIADHYADWERAGGVCACKARAQLHTATRLPVTSISSCAPTS